VLRPRGRFDDIKHKVRRDQKKVVTLRSHGGTEYSRLPACGELHWRDVTKEHWSKSPRLAQGQ